MLVDKQVQDFLKPQQNNFFHQSYNINTNNNNNLNDSYSQSHYRPYSQQKYKQRYSSQQKVQKHTLSTQTSQRSYYTGGQRHEQQSPVKMQKIFKPRNSNLIQTFEKDQKENPAFNTTFSNSFQKNTIRKTQRYDDNNNLSTAKKTNEILLTNNDISFSNNNSPLKNQSRLQTQDSRFRVGRSQTYNNSDNNLIQNFLQSQQKKNQLKRQDSAQRLNQQNQNQTLSNVPDQANQTCSEYYTQTDCNFYDNDNDDDKCYVIDYAFIDKLTLSDPRLKGAYAEELLNNPNLDIEFLIEQDPDYFHHIFGNCACAKCTCKKCQCRHNKPRLSYKSGYNTAYSLDFSQKSSGTQNSQYKTPALNQTHYNNLQEQFEQKMNIDPSFRTTQNMSYIAHQIHRKKPKNNKYVPNDKPIQRLTSYNTQFANWNDYDPNWKFKAPQHKSTVNSRANFKSNYSTDFKKGQNGIYYEYENVARNFTKTENTKPYSKIFTGVPNKTAYQQNNFDKHKESQNINLKRTFKYETETHPVNQVPAFYNQYKTVQTQDFEPKENFEQTIRTQFKNWSKSKASSNNWKRTLSHKLSELIKEKTASQNYSNAQLSQF